MGTRSIRLSAVTAALALVLSTLTLVLGSSPAHAVPPLGAITNGNASSYTVDITPDGRFVLFSSQASNIALPSTGHLNAFLRDRSTGNTTVLTQGNADVTPIAVSDDGRYITMLSRATNLVPNATNKANLYQLDRTTGTMRLLLNGTGDSSFATATPDGRFVAFQYATAPGSTPNVRVWDRTTNSSIGITNGDADSIQPWVSNDGRYVTFSSLASNLTGSTPTDHYHAYQWDRSTGVTQQVENANADVYADAATPDGRFVSLTTRATDLAPVSTNSLNQYFWDRSGHTIERLTNGNSGAITPRVSNDGRFIYFQSDATDLVAGISVSRFRVYLRDRVAGTTTLVSAEPDGVSLGDTSPDGRFVVWRTFGAHGGVWLKDRTAGAPVRLTDTALDSLSTPIPLVNSTGSVVAFASSDGNLVTPAVSGSQNVFVSDLAGVPQSKFVKTAYRDFLNRAPSANELALQTAALQGGKTRAALVKELANSPEWVSAIVNKLYLNTLGRAGDSGGVNYWTNEIRSGRRTVANVAANFYASDEYFANIGGGTNQTWVADLYVKLLHRQADASGKAYWAQQAALNGRFSVTSRFYGSAESVSTRVNDLYLALLGRNGDSGGIAYWGGRILTEGDIALAVNLASSDEYFQRAQSRFA